MAYVGIPKDLNKVKTKIAFNLTKRQLIGFCLAGIVSVPVYLNTRSVLGNDISMILLVLLAFPFLFMTFYEKDGLKAEEYFKAMYLHQFYQPKKRIKESEYIKQRKEEIRNAKQTKKKSRKVKSRSKKFKSK
ncbi:MULTISPECIES: PrgI family protein [unclassified Gemella]|uniref:PrgI family protein n=1 Tax=unclassified Gemella TaxID=2624949 RepID=UPI001C04E456|nr:MULTISPECIES: PrgI family protein [unclassified Gemella]MBU0279172.1 PrgI family protein [Gemella sp. zg-1178]QWQ38628.1 PrgI family protein [Gemella sp. zg-570]